MAALGARIADTPQRYDGGMAAVSVLASLLATSQTNEPPAPVTPAVPLLEVSASTYPGTALLL